MESRQCTKEQELPSREIVEVYVNRLVDSCNLLRTIDTGDYPFREYSSGEVSGTKRVHTKDGWETQDVYASINIFPEGNKKGLRFAVSKTIFETREVLKQWGAIEEADEVINKARTRDAGSYIGNKRDEECNGK